MLVWLRIQHTREIISVGFMTLIIMNFSVRIAAADHEQGFGNAAVSMGRTVDW